MQLTGTGAMSTKYVYTTHGEAFPYTSWVAIYLFS